MADKLSLRRKLAITAIAFVLGNAPRVRAQSSTADWETAAGGKMTFDVVSVKPNKSDGAWHSNVGLTEDGDYPSSGDRFSVTGVPLNIYIAFAYKITPRQSLLLRSTLPKWALTERFDVEAKAPIRNPTKDQMRLMVQSLLHDRFELAAHWDSRDAPVYALVMETPRKTGWTGMQYRGKCRRAKAARKRLSCYLRRARALAIQRSRAQAFWSAQCQHGTDCRLLAGFGSAQPRGARQNRAQRIF